MKKILLLICALIIVVALVLGYSLVRVYNQTSIGYCHVYNSFTNEHAKMDGGIIDLTHENEHDPVYLRVIFKDKPFKYTFTSRHQQGVLEYDSIFSIFGYYSSRYGISEIRTRSTEFNRKIGKFESVLEPFGCYYDRIEKKTIYQYGDQEFSVTFDRKILECNNVKILLRPDKVTLVVMEKGKPLSITVQDRHLFDPPIAPPAREK
jgi:hypothetical protein